MSVLSTNFYHLLGDNLPTRPSKVAIIDPLQSYTYVELATEVEFYATYFEAHSVAPGDRVVISLRKSVAEVAAMFAASKIGAAIVNANAQLTGEQLSYVVRDSTAKIAVVDKPGAKKISDCDIGDAGLLIISDSENGKEFAEWRLRSSGQTAGEITRLDTELAMIIYTSGSTGRPKGVMLSHRNIIMGARCVARYLGLNESDRLLSVLPYSFDYGLNQLTTMMLLGGTIVHQPVPMPAEVVKTAHRHNVTGLAAVPPLWGQIARSLKARPVELPSLRRVTNTGGKIPDNILKLLPEVFPGVEIYLMYGLTEAFRSTYLEPKKFEEKMGSIGQAIPGVEVYVIKSDGGLAVAGEEGELVHRGPLISMGYWGQPEATQEKIRPSPALASIIGDEPVVHSGDIVRLDADGDLWFVGRNNAMIKTGSGFRISPEEIEELVHASKMVSEVVAFGVDDDDDDTGEVVQIAVTAQTNFDLSALVLHCRMKMPAYMVPSSIHVWKSPMPRASSGKIDRTAVIHQAKRKLSPTEPKVIIDQVVHSAGQ
ncbi:MAG: AMP-binding protein [Pseudomonadota bacterium]